VPENELDGRYAYFLLSRRTWAAPAGVDGGATVPWTAV